MNQANDEHAGNLGWLDWKRWDRGGNARPPRYVGAATDGDFRTNLGRTTTPMDTEVNVVANCGTAQAR